MSQVGERPAEFTGFLFVLGVVGLGGFQLDEFVEGEVADLPRPVHVGTVECEPIVEGL